MNQEKSYKNINLFWVVNIIGWLTLDLIHHFMFYPRWTYDHNIMFINILEDSIGFIFTIILRYAYKNTKYQSYTFYRLAIVIIIGSIVTSNLWLSSSILIFIKIRILESQSLISNDITILMYLKELWPKLYTIFFWSTLYFIIKFWLEWRDQKDKTEKAVLLAQNAQLQMLRQQVDPHFLFNTLSSLRSLVRTNQKKADDMILKISDFLRYSLEAKKDNKVPLGKELEVIGHYLDIERVRFNEDLIVNYEIDPKAYDFLVPSFILHPLIENAIKYGMDTSSLPLKIYLRADVTNNVLKLEITNSGHWYVSAAKKNRSGLGIDNVRKRLELANQGNKLLINKHDGEVQVTLIIISG